MSKQLTLILGGMRSGKSSFAQELASASDRVLFLATAEPLDQEMEARIRAHKVEALLDVFKKSEASWIVVSNEVGLGLVATTEMGRIYTDELGRANRLIAAEADIVYFMTAGLPLKIKG